jgi:rare lipoprotein A
MFETRLVNAGRIIAASLAIALVAPVVTASVADAKTPGKRHCYGGVCHRVMTLAETDAQTGKLKRMNASHYDDCRRDRFNPCGLTSSGEAYRPGSADNTASSIHPDGTVLLLRNPATSAAAVVRVNNFGPFRGNRQLDVSRATAQKLGFARRGVASLEVLVVQAPTRAEARYKRNRRYAPVPGFIGQADSIDHAFLRYADLTFKERVARLDAIACQVPGRKTAPRLALLAPAGNSRPERLARGRG